MASSLVLVSNDSKSTISHHPTHAREAEDISPNLPAQYALLRRCLTQHNINLPWEKTWNKNNLILPISKLFYQPTGVSRDCHFISSSNILLSILLSNIYISLSCDVAQLFSVATVEDISLPDVGGVLARSVAVALAGRHTLTVRELQEIRGKLASPGFA